MLPGLTRFAAGKARDAFVKSLLHFDGADGFTGPFADSATPSRVWNGAGGAALSTADKKFGPSSLLLTPGKYVATASHADFEFGAGDWTIEYWQHYISGAADGQSIMCRDSAVTFTPWLIGYNQSGIQAFYATSNGSSWDLAGGIKIGTADFNPHHMVVQRKAGTFTTYDNGVLQATLASSGAAHLASSGNLTLGLWNGTGTYTYLDEVRISKGIARYSGNFTPPTTPYP